MKCNFPALLFAVVVLPWLTFAPPLPPDAEARYVELLQYREEARQRGEQMQAEQGQFMLQQDVAAREVMAQSPWAMPTAADESFSVDPAARQQIATGRGSARRAPRHWLGISACMLLLLGAWGYHRFLTRTGS